jgi:S-adenosylmethionine hydrolase
MPLITLTSDYGLVDHRVAAIKGKILSMNIDAKIVDITHEITAYHLTETAYVVRNAYSYFPAGTIHIISVDSFYSKDRKAIIYKADGHYFLAADNGLLSLIFFDQKPEAVFEITLNNRFDDVVRFTSTDIFAPAAVHLLNGGLPEVIGRKIKNPLQLTFPRAVYNESQKMISGEIMYIDNFGNVISNISKSFFEKINATHENYVVRFRNLSLNNINERYTSFIPDWKNEMQYHGKSIALFNDAELLEISIYKGNKNSGAKTLLGINLGEHIYIEFT